MSQPAAEITCPLGFGSAASSAKGLTPFHCSLCRGFLHDAVRIQPCKHQYCRFCIEPAKMCPKCGDDIANLQADPTTQGTVDTILKTHWRHLGNLDLGAMLGPPGFGSSGAPAAGIQAESDGALDFSDALLQIGLQSYAGGNLQAAYERLEWCKRELLSSLLPQPEAVVPKAVSGTQSDAVTCSDVSCSAQKERLSLNTSAPPDSNTTSTPPAAAAAAATTTDSSSHSKSNGSGAPFADAPVLATRLGAILGCQGDCCRRVGDLGRAEALYTASIDCLQPHLEEEEGNGLHEVSHALSVSLNKLGDIRYQRQDLDGASTSYLTALSLRKRALGSTSSSSTVAPSPEQVLDLATSHVKVADVMQALDNSDVGRQRLQPHLTAATALLAQLEQSSEGGDHVNSKEAAAVRVPALSARAAAQLQALQCTLQLFQQTVLTQAA